MCESQRPSSPSSRQPCLWLRFTGYDAPNFEPRNVLLQFHRASRRELSPLVRALAPFQFSSPIDCKLCANGAYHSQSFVLYALQPRSVNLAHSATALFRFSIDTATIHAQLQTAPQTPLPLFVSSPDRLQLAYEASLQPPSYRSNEEAFVLSSLEDDTLSISSSHSRSPIRPLDLSFSSVSEEGDSADDSPLASDCCASKRSKRHAKVRFCDTLRAIPTTEQLKRDVDDAAIERANLSRCVGDLASQVSQMQTQLRQLRQCAAARQADAAVLLQLNQAAAQSAKRRRVVVDGHSVARAYGNGKFKAQGICVALQYYHSRGFHAVAVISKRMIEYGKSWRESSADGTLSRLIESGLIAVTSSHSKRREFILRYAQDHNALVVCNERLQSTDTSSCSKREQRRIQTFVDSHRITFMFIANEYVPISPSLRPSRSSDCLRSGSDSGRNSF